MRQSAHSSRWGPPMSVSKPRLIVSLIGAGALIAGPLSVPANAAVVEIQILGINDFHGRLEAEGTTATSIPGAAKLAGVVDRLRALNPTGTVFVAAGDNVGASTFTSQALDDRPTIDALNAMDLDASAVGNHEFDRGYDWLSDPVTHGVDGEGRAEWLTLGANVEGEDPPMAPSTVIATGNGVNVGLVGIVTEQTGSLVSPDGIVGITFDGALAAANAEASRLKAEEQADVVILMSHEGSESTVCATIEAEDTAFGEIVRGLNDDVDALIAGHTHTPHDCTIDGRPVLQTGQYGVGLDQLTMTVDTDTNEVVSVNDAATGVVNVPTDVATANTEVAAIVAAAVAEADPIGQVPLGELPEGQDISRAYSLQPNPPPDPPSLKEDRGLESVLGNFVADVQLEATQLSAEETEAELPQIAFMNPGGLRADLLYESSVRGEGDGVVTYREAATVQPFANSLFTMSLTGEQIGQLLEQQWQPAGATRPFLHLGVSDGFTFTYDPAAAAGARITSMQLDGVDIELATDYRVAMNSFLAAGGDNFTTFRAGTGKADTGQTDLDAMVGYFEAHGTVDPSLQERALTEGQYQDDAISDFAIEVPEDLGPGERGDVTISFTSSEAIEAGAVVGFVLGDGLRPMAWPGACENFDDVFLDCSLDGIPAGETALTISVVGLSTGQDLTTSAVGQLFSADFDGNPFDPEVGGFFAEAEMVVLDGELNGQQSDLDDDGTADVVALDSAGRLLLYPGDGSGGFGARSIVGTGFHGQVVLPGDLNGDQADDVIFQASTGALYTFPNRGDGTLGKGVLVGSGFSGWTLLGPGDFDGDTFPDLIGRSPGGQLFLFLGKGDGGFRNARGIGTGWGSLTALVTPGDFNGDGTVDLVARDASNQLYLYPGSGTGSFHHRILFGTGWSFTGITGVGDFDGDLLPDLVARTASGDLFLFRGNGAGRVFKTGTKIGSGWSQLNLVG